MIYIELSGIGGPLLTEPVAEEETVNQAFRRIFVRDDKSSKNDVVLDVGDTIRIFEE